MKHIVIFLFLTASTLTACAQSKCNIKKAYAFYSVSTPGMQMSDDNGNPIPPKATVTRFIYFEWSGAKNPEIESVLYDNKALQINLTAVEGDTAILGADFSNNPDFKVVSKKCNSLWKIDLQPSGDNPVPERNSKKIIIKTKGSTNACVFKITKETLLNTLPRY